MQSCQFYSLSLKMDIDADECMEIGHGVHVGAPMPENEDERLRVLKMINVRQHLLSLQLNLLYTDLGLRAGGGF